MTKEELEWIKERYTKCESETGYRTQRNRLLEKREYAVLDDIVALIEELERLHLLRT